MAQGRSATPLKREGRDIAARLAVAFIAAAGFAFVAWQARQPQVVSRVVFTMRPDAPPILNAAGDDFADPVLLQTQLAAADAWAEAKPAAKPRNCPKGPPSYRAACADMLRSLAAARSRRSPPP